MRFKLPLQSVAAVMLSLSMTSMPALSADVAGPFSYPAGLLYAPATLTQPVGDYAQIGMNRVFLEDTTLYDLASLTGATRLREGTGDFKRDTLCLSGTENGRPLIAWFIATDTDKVTEVQTEWVGENDVPEYCRPLEANRLPVRLGRIGLGMSEKEVAELIGPSSYVDNAGWHYWFSQRFMRNEKNLQELELNWLALRFDEKARVERAFISQVTNL